METVQNILRRVVASHRPQNMVFHGLWVDGDAIDVVRLEKSQFFTGDGVWATRFDGELCAILNGEICLHHGEQMVELGRRQGGGCATAHIERRDGFARLFEHLTRLFDLFAE